MNEHDFKIDDNIIYSIIQKQAGTLEKAFLELIMNSIDAEASKVEILFDGYKFEIIDDGKGFENEDTIHKFFGTFGTPHKEGDSIYGSFRMGRGQIMAFSKNSWYSNIYSMDVDIKNNGTKYNLKKDCDFFDGCKISGTLYEELEPFEVKSFEKELKEFIKFSQIPVYLNKELISTKIEDIKWDIINDDAYIQIDKRRNLSVYNLGVKVREYSSWNIGYGGIVVSKKPLEVNFARNDILKKSCPIWKTINNEIKTLLSKKSSASSKEEKVELSPEERAVISKQFITGELDYDVGRKLKLFTDIQGKHHSMMKFMDNTFITKAKGYDRLGDKVHLRKIAFVLHNKVLENFGVENLKELISELKKRSKENKDYLSQNSAYKDYNKYFADSNKNIIEDISFFKEQIRTRMDEVKEEKLTKKQKLTLKVLNQYEKDIRELVNKYSSPKVSKRALKVGNSEIAEAWTDGKSYIVIEENLLKLGHKGTAGFTKLANLLLHEYIHRNNDVKSHSHDAVFYEIFHICSQHVGEQYRNTKKLSIGNIAFRMTKTYFKLLEENKIKVPQTYMTLSAKAYKQLFINPEEKKSGRMPLV